MIEISKCQGTINVKKSNTSLYYTKVDFSARKKKKNDDVGGFQIKSNFTGTFKSV